MEYTTQVTAVFNCPIDRAFKTPMLCDVAKVHTGHLVMPRVTHCKDDESWGKPGGTRRVFMAPNLFFEGGESALDTVIERRENQYWKIHIDHLRIFTMGIYRFQGEWYTKPLSESKTEVTYVYTLYTRNPIGFPFYWLFTQILWKNYMQHALENIKKMAENNEPYVFD